MPSQGLNISSRFIVRFMTGSNRAYPDIYIQYSYLYSTDVKEYGMSLLNMTHTTRISDDVMARLDAIPDVEWRLAKTDADCGM